MTDQEIFKALSAIKFPVMYDSGSIVDADGKTVIKANRDSNTSPLRPSERDDMLKAVVILINRTVLAGITG